MTAGERSDLTARLRFVGLPLCDEAADRIETLEAENAARIADIAALEFDVCALDELNITLEAECDLLRAAIKSDDVFRYTLVKPGQAVRPDGVVCDLVEATDENAAFTRSHVIDRITTDRAWILRPVVDPEGGTR